jgi:hypothetical protein
VAGGSRADARAARRRERRPHRRDAVGLARDVVDAGRGPEAAAVQRALLHELDSFGAVVAVRAVAGRDLRAGDHERRSAHGLEPDRAGRGLRGVRGDDVEPLEPRGRGEVLRDDGGARRRLDPRLRATEPPGRAATVRASDDRDRVREHEGLAVRPGAHVDALAGQLATLDARLDRVERVLARAVGVPRGATKSSRGCEKGEAAVLSRSVRGCPVVPGARPRTWPPAAKRSSRPRACSRVLHRRAPRTPDCTEDIGDSSALTTSGARGTRSSAVDSRRCSSRRIPAKRPSRPTERRHGALSRRTQKKGVVAPPPPSA